MNLKYVILGTALLVPVALVSCDNSKAPTETAVDDPTDIEAPSFTTVGFGSRYHDPHIDGAEIKCFSGSEDTKNDPEIEGGPFFGDCKRFKSKDGAEVVTFDGDDNPNNAYAGISGKKNLIKGKLVGKVKELDFGYAGGPPAGGSPEMAIPIDVCQPVIYETGQTGVVPCTTDGATDAYIFADVTDFSGCNDGDGFVGIFNGEDDETCKWFLGGTIEFPSWHAFVAAHPDYRIATDAVPFAIVEAPGHYLLFKWDVR